MVALAQPAGDNIRAKAKVLAHNHSQAVVQPVSISILAGKERTKDMANMVPPERRARLAQVEQP